MAQKIRRVVTGHDAEGKAIVLMDGDATAVSSGRANQAATVLWSTEGFPVDNTLEGDLAEMPTGTTHSNGTVFRVVEYGPGVAPRRHRTDSVDYGVVMSGEIDMELDDGVVVHLKAGDVVVQRGTIHNWVNNGSEPCLIAFTLIDGKPVEVGGQVVKAEG